MNGALNKIFLNRPKSCVDSFWGGLFVNITGHITVGICGCERSGVCLRCQNSCQKKSIGNNKILETMKKMIFVFALAAAAVVIAQPAAAEIHDQDRNQTQNVTTKTHFEGQAITGVEASGAFDVVLVRSIQTRAVVEASPRFADRVRISRSAEGVVTVGLENVRMNRRDDRDVLRLVIYLPSVSTIRLTGSSDLFSRDEFTGRDVDIMLSGASELKGLALRGGRVKLQCSGSSEASLRLSATEHLVMMASGASEVELHAADLKYSRIGVSGASEVDIDGTGDRGDWTVSGASDVSAGRFAMRELNVLASGASDVVVNVGGPFRPSVSGSAEVRNVR